MPSRRTENGDVKAVKRTMRTERVKHVLLKSAFGLTNDGAEDVQKYLEAHGAPFLVIVELGHSRMGEEDSELHY